MADGKNIVYKEDATNGLKSYLESQANGVGSTTEVSVKIKDWLDKGADPRVQIQAPSTDFDGASAAHFLVYINAPNTLEIAIKNGADLKQASSNGKIPAHHLGSERVVEGKLLPAPGRTLDDKTPTRMVEILERNGTDWAAMDNQHNKPYDYLNATVQSKLEKGVSLQERNAFSRSYAEKAVEEVKGFAQRDYAKENGSKTSSLESSYQQFLEQKASGLAPQIPLNNQVPEKQASKTV